MKYLHYLLPFIFILGINCQINAQDLHIHYDKQNDKVRFEQNGKEIKNPKVKKGDHVYLHIENYNNYIYRADVRVDQVSLNPPSPVSGNPLMGLLPQGVSSGANFNLLDMGVNKLKSGLIGLIESSGTSDETDAEDILGFGGKDEDITGFALLKEEYDATLEKLESIEKDFQKIGEEVKKELDSKKVREFALEEINKLKHNPDLTPAQIKKLSKEYFDKVFKEKQVDELELNELLAMGDLSSQLARNTKQLKIKSKEYASAEEKLKYLEERTGSMLGFASAQFGQIKKELDETFGFIAVVKEGVEEDVKTLEKLSTQDSKTDLKQIMALRKEYEILEKNEFRKTFRVQADKDVVNFNLSFAVKDSTGRELSTSPVSSIKVPVSGGFKVHPSLGISFGQFFERPQEFNVKNDVIVASDADSFTPVITSFLHFYRQSANGPSIGGSFGIGFPIVSSGTDQSLFFLIGPSLIVGKESRIVISGGILGGKVNRLGAGYEVGDSFDNSLAVLPISSKYEMGYFLGVSYNLGN